MAKIPNNHALTVSDGNQDFFNVNTIAQRIEIPNGATIQFYSDNYITPGVQLTPTGTAPIVSATSPAIANAATITTSGVGIARVTPAAARTGIILQAGTIAGQSCWVINEATSAASSITFDVSGTSGVADGISNVIYGNQARHFSWDAATSLWVASSPLVSGSLPPPVVSTVAITAGSGTISTSGVGIARSNPSGNITGVILQAGTIPGQLVIVENKSAFSITFATSATSNVGNGTSEVIAAKKSRLYCWDADDALWY